MKNLSGFIFKFLELFVVLVQRGCSSIKLFLHAIPGLCILPVIHKSDVWSWAITWTWKYSSCVNIESRRVVSNTACGISYCCSFTALTWRAIFKACTSIMGLHHFQQRILLFGCGQNLTCLFSSHSISSILTGDICVFPDSSWSLAIVSCFPFQNMIFRFFWFISFAEHAELIALHICNAFKLSYFI